jgi:hypothetical protein
MLLKKQYNHNEGTRPPIPKSFQSPWVGKPMNELVEWLNTKPDDTDLNDCYFAILDKGARDDPPTVVVCWIDTEHHKLFLERQGVGDAASHLIGAPKDSWTEFARYGGTAEIRYDDDDGDGDDDA